jgi:hypothetical protein
MAEYRQDKFDGCAKGLVLYRKERIEGMMMSIRGMDRAGEGRRVCEGSIQI